MSKSTCSIAECDEPVNARGMCKPHYRKDYYARNKARENANFKAYYQSNLEAMRQRSIDYGESRWGGKRAEARSALARRLASSDKACSRCQEVKPKAEYHTDPRRLDGLYSQCKACFALATQTWETANKHVRRVQRSARYAADPEYRERMKAKHRAWARKEYASNPEFADRSKRKVREWVELNPLKATMLRRRSSNARRARIRDQSAGPVDYRVILERDGMICHLCLEGIPSLDVLHFDHVIPLAKGGPHSMDNIKPSHAACNLSKGAKLIP